jgi:ATP:corrinoid adenosyltransferase
MKPFNELTARQKFYRQNIVRLIIYGSFAAVLYWSVSEILEIVEQKEKPNKVVLTGVYPLVSPKLYETL